MSTFISYRVASGDTLFSIARRYNMTVDELKAANNLVSNNLSVGQTLRVKSTAGPGSGTVVVIKPQTGGTGGSTLPPPPPPSGGTAVGYLAARQEFSPTVTPDVGCKRYTLPVRLLNGSTVVANMRDNLTMSRHMVYPNGISYAGQSRMALDLPTIQSVGLTLQQAVALRYVSTHEGGFDAINSYDKAIFSYGFIQFTGAAAVGGSLNRVMASMKANAPNLFNRIFQRVGIDSAGAQTTVRNEAGATLSGDNAWLYIQRNVPLYGAFVQAGFEPQLIREQLRMANDLYVQPALNFKLDLNIGGIRITVPRLRDILSSEAALTIVIALAINQGNGGMSRMVADAVSRVAAQQRINSLSTLRQVDERAVFNTVAASSTDERVINRVNGVIGEGLSFGKA
ncbi:MAG TPA: LysM peptidoglycan-binding domain-containing protein [Saprospiraceae bacterium]|nr:LysM peptidoglycan-binding domain-containing protein [Saprospiraceae bacterium]HND87720.1 LysM peptidoglycan-binding domain-containing protein [Saprospiraceae bacterium]